VTNRSRRPTPTGPRATVVRVVVGLLLLGLPSALPQAAAAGAPVAWHHGHPGHGVRPGSFDGDVRLLPAVPSSSPAPEGEEPDASRPGGDEVPAVEASTPNMPSASASFDGLHFAGTCTGGSCGAGWPPDTVGDVGPNHYVEAVNTSVGIFTKTGTQLAAFTFNSLWSGAGTGTACDTTHRGDPTVVYDPMADRWFVADFAFASPTASAPPYYECIAVSKTGDPVSGGWWLYAIRADDASHPYLNDYPKMAIWPDGLYMTANMFDCRTSCVYIGVRVWVLNRAQMEAGAAVQSVLFDTGGSYFSLLPSNLRGTAPPTGSPNYLVSEDLGDWKFDVFEVHVDWATPANSTLTGPIQVSQASYPYAGGAFIPQPGTANTIDSLEDRLMMQAQYRNISGVESVWVSHTVGSSPAGVQWAQLDVTGGTVATTPVQQQIWSNVGSDGVYRWMPSLAVDRFGNMAVGYSASSSGVFPSIRYAGRLSSDPPNTLSQGEATLVAGAGSQTNTCGGAACHRWGDYTSMSVDPTDDCTFWYVGQYYGSTSGGASGDWLTRIGSFRYPACSGGGSADLSISKTDSPDPVVADSALTYTLAVRNAGSSNATNVVVTDTLPASVRFGSAAPSQGTCSGTVTVSCSLGSVNNGSTAVVTISVTPVAPGTLSNTASVSATQSDPNAANNSATQSTTVKAQKKTKYVSVTDAGFSAANLGVPQGSTAQWNILGPSPNGVADSTGLYASGTRTPVDYLPFTFTTAGKYTASDVLGHTMRVSVAAKVAPTSGTTATTFTLTWGSASAPAGFAVDVQIRRPGGAWVSWRTGQTGTGATFVPDAGAGTYQFRVRLRNTGTSAASAYSGAKKISVS
jgi:uncharacterized repeat protein (TIGR01451 family)